MAGKKKETEETKFTIVQIAEDGSHETREISEQEWRDKGENLRAKGWTRKEADVELAEELNEE